MTPMSEGSVVPLVVVERGGRVESVHHGAIAVTDATGRLIASAGSPGLATFTRSALKPFQALPFVLAGGPSRFGLSQQQVALLCASHSGEVRHQVAVADLLARAGCSASELACGSHAPYVYDSLDESPPPPPYSPLGHNCSGKHAGMLACCTLHGWRKDSYVDPAHPLQRAIRAAVARLSGIAEDTLAPAVDGCSAPNYELPLSGLACAYARLASGAAGDDGAACRTLSAAMAAHPEYVSGTGGGDLALMRAGSGRWIAKTGAEGVQTLGLVREGVGIAIKVADGAHRAKLPIAIAVLDALGFLDGNARQALTPLASPLLHNARGTEVGRIRSVLVLDKSPERHASAAAEPRR